MTNSNDIADNNELNIDNSIENTSNQSESGLKSSIKALIIIGLFCVYAVISAALLIPDHYRKREYATYDMACVNDSGNI